MFVKSLIAISDYDEQNLHRLIGHNWITRHNDKLRVDLNFIAIRYIQYFWNLYQKLGYLFVAHVIQIPILQRQDQIILANFGEASQRR